METITITTDDFKELMRQTMIDILTEHKDLIENAVVEALEDIGLCIAIQEGKTGEYVDNQYFMSQLEMKTNNVL